MKIRAVVLERPGGPEELRLRELEIAGPGPGEILVRHTAIGVNCHDCYVRSGHYQTLPLPGIPGLEGVGVVEAIGPEVVDSGRVAVGDRVAWISPSYGGYASHRVISATDVIRLPADPSVSDPEWAATLMKAMTVQILVTRAHRVRSGQVVLVHAAAGGVGQLLTSWCRHLGATVVGTVGSTDKAVIAKRAGAHHAINYRTEDFVERVLDLTGGQGVAVAFDAVGKDTFEGSLDCLDVLGTLVAYGQASGPPPPVTMARLAERSLTVVRPILFHYLREAAEPGRIASDVFAAVRDRAIRPIHPLTVPLVEAAGAHEVLEARQSPGGVVLLP